MRAAMKHELSRLKIAVMYEDESLPAVEAETEMRGVGRVVEVTRSEAAVTVGAMPTSKPVPARSVSCRSEASGGALCAGTRPEKQNRETQRQASSGAHKNTPATFSPAYIDAARRARDF